MDRVRCYALIAALSLLLASACSTPLITTPLSVSKDRWDLSLLKLAAGPDQYRTAGGCWRPREGERYVWATVRLRNTLKTPQVFRLDRLLIRYGGVRKRPAVIDMDCFISMKANPAPKLAPGETIHRRIAYRLPRGVTPERLTYENEEIVIPETTVQ
jgi:hypothetical protein